MQNSEKNTCYRRIHISILIDPMYSAKELLVAMEACGLIAYEKRTYMRHLALEKLDVFWHVVFPIFVIGIFIAWNTFK